MAGNNVVWQPQVVEDMLRYYKEKIQAEGRLMVFREIHHEECAKQINAKYHTKQINAECKSFCPYKFDLVMLLMYYSKVRN